MTDQSTSALARLKQRRRTYSRTFKAKLVRLAEAGEWSVARVAMEHKVNANLLRRWMTLARASGSPAAMVPVRVTSAPDTESTGSALEVALVQATLRFHPPWEPQAVAALLKALR